MTSEVALDHITSEHGLSLSELARELSGATLHGDPETRVFGVHHDSRRVKKGDLFVARKGITTDGNKFIDAALANGASAVLAQKGTISASAAFSRIEVDDLADGFALASAAVYEHPSFGLEVIGVTGTNGKTTTTHLIAAAIDGALHAHKCGIIGTVGFKYSTLAVEPSLTTPEADELARAMLAMRRLGASHVTMEVSSIALSLGRSRAVRFQVAAFTNLTQDHLDFHGSMVAYGEAKAKLFIDSAPGVAVICVDGPFGLKLADRVNGRVIRVSAKLGEDADVAPTELSLSARGIEAVMRTPQGPVSLRSPLVGAHNVENLAVALGVVCALGVDARAAAEALVDELGAPGRLERCDTSEDDIAVFVDYAHTPDALARVLDAVRAVTSDRVICVFGCGGDRDPSKRGPMGDAVARRADVAIVTSDNPRTEDPAAIAAPIVEAIEAAGKACILELDRAHAIAMAVASANKGDVIVIAGKGHEPYQIVGTEKRPFDDREQARTALAKRREAA
jgi:UDP-N-acetylmuramoyl-L-alanyl-D-glutamate--2,6-diaminopimelate ligase